MRKMILILCVVIGSVSLLYSANLQKIYSHDSEIYRAIQSLYINQGVALPSTSGPFSGAELLLMIDKININTAPIGEQELYNFVVDSLRKEGERVITFTLQTAVETYLHTDITNFVKPEEWIRGYNERKAPLNLTLESWPGDNFYGYSELAFQGSKYASYNEGSKEPLSTTFGVKRVTTNLSFTEDLSKQLDMTIPYRAFASFGSSRWSVQIGREQLSWGAGVSGNFLLSDHVKYHNVGRVTTFTERFKYTFLASFFPHPLNYYDYKYDEKLEGEYNPYTSQLASMHGLRVLIAHRLEGRFFKDRVGFSLTEAIMYQSEDNTFDLSVLSPTAIFHNYYIKANANSLLTIELDYTPIKHLNIYTQIALDEFAVPGAEKQPGEDTLADPNAFGVVFGAKSAFILSQGVISATVEGAYTNPYLYLRGIGYRI